MYVGKLKCLDPPPPDDSRNDVLFLSRVVVFFLDAAGIQVVSVREVEVRERGREKITQRYDTNTGAIAYVHPYPSYLLLDSITPCSA